MNNSNSNTKKEYQNIDPNSPNRKLVTCPSCRGKGEIEYLLTGHYFECDWCEGSGKVTPETADKYIKMMIRIHGEMIRFWL